MFGFKKEVKDDGKQEDKQLFVKIDGNMYSEKDMESMTVAELDRLIIKMDLAIDDCEGALEHLVETCGEEDPRIRKTRYACKKLKEGRILAVATKRMKTNSVKQDIEHFFMEQAKRMLTENQYNRILVKAQAEFELQ